MKRSEVKVGDTIRSTRPKCAGIEDSYVHFLIESESQAKLATELVASGGWVVVSKTKTEDDPCEN